MGQAKSKTRRCKGEEDDLEDDDMICIDKERLDIDNPYQDKNN